jgi:DNA-binding MarR family transcriptional regulator
MVAEAKPELARLVEEVVRCYLTLNQTATMLHGHEDLSGPRRTLLVMLSHTGPLSVAQIARERHEARQRVQPLVNGLVTEGTLAYGVNPAHKRSPLVKLTPKGEKAVKHIIDVENTLRARLKLDVSNAAMAAAADVLRRVRAAVQDPATLLLIAQERKVKR